MAGCEGEVHLYSLFIDDTAQAGRQAVATACQALAQGEPLPDQASQPHLTRWLTAKTLAYGTCSETAFKLTLLCCLLLLAGSCCAGISDAPCVCLSPSLGKTQLHGLWSDKIQMIVIT